jgi:hypothetical protein
MKKFKVIEEGRLDKSAMNEICGGTAPGCPSTNGYWSCNSPEPTFTIITTPCAMRIIVNCPSNRNYISCPGGSDYSACPSGSNYTGDPVTSFRHA